MNIDQELQTNLIWYDQTVNDFYNFTFLTDDDFVYDNATTKQKLKSFHCSTLLAYSIKMCCMF